MSVKDASGLVLDRAGEGLAAEGDTCCREHDGHDEHDGRAGDACCAGHGEHARHGEHDEHDGRAGDACCDGHGEHARHGEHDKHDEHAGHGEHDDGCGCCDEQDGQDDECCAACAASEGRKDGGAEEASGAMLRFGSYALPLRRVAVFASALCLWAAGLALLRWGPAGALLRYLPLLPFAAAYLLAGLPVLRRAFRQLRRGKAVDENFLMSIATLGAFAVGDWEEAVGVMIFYMIGELIQEAAVLRSRRSIRALLALKPDSARRREGGAWVEVEAGAVAVGDELLVRPGERIPVDGLVLEGSGSIDASMLTGESRPLEVKAGAELQSGTVNLDGLLTLRALRNAEHSQAAKIIALVESARESKASPERFITAFARWYTPIVVGFAAILALAPPLLIPGAQFQDWLYRALILLVISCPCALVVSIPLGYFAGIGGLSRRGIMVKGAVHLDSLYKARYVAFDKTGTLTEGKFAITALEPAAGESGAALLEAALAAEGGSNHPIARAIQSGCAERGISVPEGGGSGYREIAGYGVEAGPVLAGNRRFLESRGVALAGGLAEAAGTAVYVARNGRYLGRILIGDRDREGAAEAVSRLRRLGIRETVMFTGDARRPAEEAARRMGISEVRAELLPQDKLEAMEELTSRGVSVFVGDGINDAPVLARADVGIAMGGGSDAAVEAADVIIMTDDPRRVPEAIERARRTRRIVVQNTVFALASKAVFIALAVMGKSNMWLALLADVGVALLAVVNATRALK